AANCTIHDLAITNSPFWNIRIGGSGIEVRNIAVTVTTSTKNTDGIDTYNANGVWIHDSTFTVNDDCVAIKQGSHNVVVDNISCLGAPHGLSIGSVSYPYSLGPASVSNILFQNIKLSKGTNGCRIKTVKGATGLVQGITYRNIVLTSTSNPVIVTQQYCDTSGGQVCDGTGNVLIKDVVFENVTGVTKGTKITCASGTCTNFKLSGVPPGTCTGVTGTNGNALPSTCV
ncbi:hypothetical protein HK096_010855, partial [Nowakowskiella sp. JEL0078]